MDLRERIIAFDLLGKRIKQLKSREFDDLAWRIENNNSWFTPGQTKSALEGIGLFLDADKLYQWLKPYGNLDNPKPKSVGILMAGNIPAVGFHDLMCVLITGNQAHVKLSSTDQVLIKWLVDELILLEPEFEEYVIFEEMLRGKDAYIATGSDNSSRYFDYYFGKYPSIIRKNRTSIAVLDGNESTEDFIALGKDVFQYFGMGCRNVSKLYINDPSVLIKLLDAFQEFDSISDNHKFTNNYDYNKSIYLVNREEHLDNGFLLLKESKELVSPISVLYYEIYNDHNDLQKAISSARDKIQCVVSREAWFEGSYAFGAAQYPTLDDYADGIDTIEFLKGLREDI